MRYAILGLLEFIDWGGGDILYYASDYLSKTVDENRYAAPQIIHDNMHNKRNGVTDGEGFYNYRDMDVAAYRQRRMQGIRFPPRPSWPHSEIADDAQSQ